MGQEALNKGLKGRNLEQFGAIHEQGEVVLIRENDCRAEGAYR